MVVLPGLGYVKNALILLKFQKIFYEKALDHIAKTAAPKIILRITTSVFELSFNPRWHYW